MNPNKEKGKRFETRVAKTIAEIWGLPDECVHRTLASGSFTYTFGDIEFKCGQKPNLVIECKRDAKQTLEKLFFSIPRKWIAQLEREVKKAEKITGRKHFGIVVWGKPHGKMWVITEESLFPFVEELFIPKIKTSEWFYIFPLEDFLLETKSIFF